jgi:hypothetical protein
MASLTITLDDEVLRRAQARATQQETSLDGVLRNFLEAYGATGSSLERAAEEILRLSSQARSGREGSRWARDELHDR